MTQHCSLVISSYELHNKTKPNESVWEIIYYNYAYDLVNYDILGLEI